MILVSAVLLTLVVQARPQEAAHLRREELAKAAISEFYACLAEEQMSPSCKGVLHQPEDELREMSPAVRSTLETGDPSRAVWTYLRRLRTAMTPAGGGSVTFIRTSLSEPPSFDVLTIEVVGAAAEPAQTSGVTKLIRFGLTWSNERDKYGVSPISVNGIEVFPPGGFQRAPEDLLGLLGYRSSSQKP